MARPFMMAFLARSGSGAILYDLDHHPKTIIHMEVFGEPTLPGGLEQTDQNRVAFMHRMWAGHRNPDLMPPELEGCARGFKLQFNYARPQFQRIGLLVEALKLNRAVVIALRREDVLRHAISAIRARRLKEVSLAERGVGDAHIKPESGPNARAFAHEPIQVDLERLAGLIDGITLSRRKMARFLARYPASVEVTYEEYLADRLGVLNRILAALELEPFKEAPPQDMQKITDNDLSKAVSNYDEIRDFAAERGLRA